MTSIYEIHNAQTGEIIRHEMTAKEIAAAQKIADETTSAKASADAVKASARQAVLDKLGLTSGEVSALLG